MSFCCLYKPNPLFALIKRSWVSSTAQAWDSGLFPLGVVELNTLANSDKRGHQSLIAIKIDMVGNKNRRQENSLQSPFLPGGCRSTASQSLMAWKMEGGGENCVRRQVSSWVLRGFVPEITLKSGNLSVAHCRETSALPGLDTAGNPWEPIILPQTRLPAEGILEMWRGKPPSSRGFHREEMLIANSNWQLFIFHYFVIGWSVSIFFFILFMDIINASCHTPPEANTCTQPWPRVGYISYVWLTHMEQICWSGFCFCFFNYHYVSQMFFHFHLEIFNFSTFLVWNQIRSTPFGGNRLK